MSTRTDQNIEFLEDIVDAVCEAVGIDSGAFSDARIDAACRAIEQKVPVAAAGLVLLAALKELASASEEFATSDPDMPSHKDTEKRFDRALMAGLDAIAKAEGR